MIKWILYKLVTIKDSIFQKKIENSYDKKEGLYYLKINGLKLVSNSSIHFYSLYKTIFIKEIYKISPSTSTPFIIDCGANIGLGICYWKQKFPNAEILAFEPDPDVFYALEINSNKFSGINLFQNALSDKIGKSEFTSNGKLSGSLNLSKKLDKTIEVEKVLLSNFITKKVDLLKIDIEGEEVKVLKEIKSKLHLVQNIFIEYHSFSDKPQELSEVLVILQEEGFRYYLDSDVKNNYPFIKVTNSLNQDLQVNIWAFR